MKYLIVLFLSFIYVGVSSHNTNEITYEFELNKTNNTLLIHFTPKSAIDLIRTINPELKQETIIKLDDYHADFTDYFNKTINLKVENSMVYFSFVYADLQSHDAVFGLKIIGIPKEYNQLELEITSFLEVYKRTTNFVMFKTENNYLEYNLDKDNRIYKSTINDETNIEVFDFKFAILLLFVSISLLVILLRKEILLVMRGEIKH